MKTKHILRCIAVVGVALGCASGMVGTAQAQGEVHFADNFDQSTLLSWWQPFGGVNGVATDFNNQPQVRLILHTGGTDPSGIRHYFAPNGGMDWTMQISVLVLVSASTNVQFNMTADLGSLTPMMTMTNVFGNVGYNAVDPATGKATPTGVLPGATGQVGGLDTLTMTKSGSFLDYYINGAQQGHWTIDPNAPLNGLTLSGINQSGSPAGYILSGFKVDVTPVPEPSTYALIGMCATFGLWAYRRSKHKLRSC